MLAAIRARVPPDTVIHAAGVSLGGSVLLNWLGRAGAAAARDAHRGRRRLDAARPDGGRPRHRPGLNRIYAWHFLWTLKPKSLASWRAAFRRCSTKPACAACYSMYEFDDAVTAPLHGFAGTLDYWTRAILQAVASPTSPFRRSCSTRRTIRSCPAASLPGPNEVSRSVLLEQPDEGGHCGFLVGPFPGTDHVAAARGCCISSATRC